MFVNNPNASKRWVFVGVIIIFVIGTLIYQSEHLSKISQYSSITTSGEMNNLPELIAQALEKNKNELHQKLLSEITALQDEQLSELKKIVEKEEGGEKEKKEVRTEPMKEVKTSSESSGKKCDNEVPRLEDLEMHSYKTAGQKYKAFLNWRNKTGDSTMLFLHIHKAGGTEMRKLLIESLEKKQNYKTATIESYSHCFTRFASQVGKGQRSPLAKLSDVFKAKPDKLFTFTSIRHPTNRMLSQYDFEQRWNGQYGKYENEDQIWLTSPESQLGWYIDEKGKVIDRFMGRNHYTRYFGCEKTGCKITPAVFKNAVKTLNSIDMIFITEWYDDNRTSTMMRSVLDMPNLKIKHRSFRTFITNRGKIKAVNPDLIEKLECENQWDIRLYEYAKKIVYDRFKTFMKSKNEIDQTKSYKQLLETEESWYITDPLKDGR